MDSIEALVKRYRELIEQADKPVAWLIEPVATQALTIIVALAESDPTYSDYSGYGCALCEDNTNTYRPLNHKPDCPYRRACEFMELINAIPTEADNSAQGILRRRERARARD